MDDEALKWARNSEMLAVRVKELESENKELKRKLELAMEILKGGESHEKDN